MDESDFSRKFKRLIAAEYSLLSHAALIPFRPKEAHLRRILIAGELLRSRLPLVRLETLVGTDFDDASSVNLRAVAQHDHNCSIYELLALALMARKMQPKRAFEIGTYDGRSALAIASNMPEESELFTLNLPPNYGETKQPQDLKYDEKLASKVISGCRWQVQPEMAGRIHQLFGNSVEFDFTPYTPMQFIFIDGGHDELTVRADTHNALKMIDRNRGIILWHDAPDFGVRPALARFIAEGHRISLIEGTSLGVLRFEGGNEVNLQYK